MSTLLKVVKKVKAKEIVNKIINNPIRNTNNFNREKFENKYIINEKYLDNHQIITLTRDGSYNDHIIYLHGGSFRDEALIVHRLFVERILKKYNVKITFLDYPLIPEHDHVSIQSFVYNSYEYLIKKYKNDKFYFIGDSAGCGLIVRMLKLINKNDIIVNKSVLLSPWIDVSMSNPLIKKQLSKDFTLDYNDLVKCGKEYAGRIKTTSKIVSPINDKLNNLGDLLIFTSDNELLYPDIVKFDSFVNKCENSSSSLIIGHELCHDYELLIIKETKTIIKDIMNFLLKE